MSHAKDMHPRAALLSWLAERATAVDAAIQAAAACQCRTPSPMRYLRQSWCRLCDREIVAEPAGMAQDARAAARVGRC